MTATGTQQTAASEITGPTWDLEYPALDAPELKQDLHEALDAIEHIERISSPVADVVANASSLSLEEVRSGKVLGTVVQMFQHYWTAVILLRNVGTYASCVSSVDGTDDDARKLSAEIQELFARVKTAFEPAGLFLDTCTDDVANAFIATNDITRAASFSVLHSRKMKDHKLSLSEENMATSLSVTGHSAWGSLYTDLSSVISANVKQTDGSVKSMGVASAAALLDSPHEQVRRNAWEAIREAWLPHQETCAAVLNAITGWRLSLYEKRGLDSFLDSALHMNRMSNNSLEALFDALDANSHVGQRALRVQAEALSKPALDLWDLFAPAPALSAGSTVNGTASLYTFDEGIELIANAVSQVDDDAGAFVRLMQTNRWIEASRGDKKRPGA